MKRIEVILRPAAYPAVRGALQRLGLHVMNVSRVEAMDRRRADPGAEPGGGDLTPDARSAVRIELVVPDEQVVRVRDAIAECPHGPFRSPGRILISAVDEVVELGSQLAETAATHLPARP